MTAAPDERDVAARLDRLESFDELRQLVSRYGMLIDSRDIEGVVDLFVPDTRVTRTQSGSDALRAVLHHLLSRFTTSIHSVSNHTIELVDADHAEGVVYSRVEHEYGDEWIILALQYWDRYERRDDRRWRFTGRQLKFWYAVDVLERPNGPDKVRWDLTGPATVPDVYPTWAQFWADH